MNYVKKLTTFVIVVASATVLLNCGQRPGEMSGDMTGRLIRDSGAPEPCWPPIDTCMVIRAIPESLVFASEAALDSAAAVGDVISKGCGFFCCPPVDTCDWAMPDIKSGDYFIRVDREDSTGSRELVDFFRVGPDTATTVSIVAGGTTSGIDITLPSLESLAPPEAIERTVVD